MKILKLKILVAVDALFACLCYTSLFMHPGTRLINALTLIISVFLTLETIVDLTRLMKVVLADKDFFNKL